jgi:hypothetical protein
MMTLLLATLAHSIDLEMDLKVKFQWEMSYLKTRRFNSLNRRSPFLDAALI